MASSGSSRSTLPTLNELMDLSADDVRNRLTKLYVMIREMKSMEDCLAVYDALDYLRDTHRRENDKLVALTNLLVQTTDGIREKEGHVDIMDLSD
ncbi:hypothetical protein Tco_0655045 [Tanacetum coccineum]|uniref:Uncharacterized protein n=1 Tax=Tanacetum coccineum TaxID=301880 RepID=A0ABQ4X514_9ASTR